MRQPFGAPCSLLSYAQLLPQKSRVPHAGKEQDENDDVVFDAKVERVGKTRQERTPEIRMDLEKSFWIAPGWYWVVQARKCCMKPLIAAGS